MSKKLLVTFVLLFVLLFSANLMAADVTEHSADGVTVMSSAENFPSLYLTSDDPVNKGRRWVESSLEKENKATGSMKLVKSNGDVIYEGTLTQIKGRGNSTWYAPKKPYQIKLSEKFDLLQTGDKNNKSKTWVLLANYYDIAMMRNRIVFDLAASMQMENPIQYTYVNLFYDGEFRGLYQLSEKVEVDKGRVEIADLEGDNEDANPDVDLEDLPSSMDKTSNGATYVYCQNMKNPENITGGYLLEMDYVARAEEEACYFRTRRNRYIVVKSPEFCSKEQMDYIASLYQELEDAVHFGGVNPFTGKKYSDYIDPRSAAVCYLINELSKNGDGFVSSAYLYKDADTDQMKMGPLWDYDHGFAIPDKTNLSLKTADVEGLYTATYSFGRALYDIPDFREVAREVYVSEMYPLIRDGLGGIKEMDIPSYSDYVDESFEDVNKDHRLWYPDETNNRLQKQFDVLEQFIQKRGQWLYTEISGWSKDKDVSINYFTDVMPSDWYYDSVENAYRAGLVSGMGGGSYLPDLKTTRAQCVQVLYNYSSDMVMGYRPVFSDVEEGFWGASALLWGYDHKVAIGYPDGTFMPNSNVRRQDFVVMLYRYIEEPEADPSLLAPFEDSVLVSDYAVDAMAWAVGTGLINGRTETTLCPGDPMTRAELATLILRFYDMTK